MTSSSALLCQMTLFSALLYRLICYEHQQLDIRQLTSENLIRIIVNVGQHNYYST